MKEKGRDGCIRKSDQQSQTQIKAMKKTREIRNDSGSCKEFEVNIMGSMPSVQPASQREVSCFQVEL